MFSKVVSTLLLIVGVIVFMYGTHLSQEASQGEQKISEASEEAAGQRKPLLGPIRKSVRAHQAETAQKKIGNSKERVAEILTSADWMQGTGIVLFIVGLGWAVFTFSRKRR